MTPRKTEILPAMLMPEDPIGPGEIASIVPRHATMASTTRGSVIRSFNNNQASGKTTMLSLVQMRASALAVVWARPQLPKRKARPG